MLKLWSIYFLLLSSTSLEAAEWNFKNNPFFKASKILEAKIDLLPQSFEISNFMVSNYHWPINEGGILNRWAQQNPKKQNDKFSFQFFPFENLKYVDLSQLSPPEKFDLFLGNSNWAFSRFIKNLQNGLLNSEFKTQLAFSESILKFKNPAPISLEGKSSLMIPFGSSDIKALLFASLLLDSTSNTKIVGEPCKLSFNETDINKIKHLLENCEGMNPGTFHLILSNYLGLRGEGITLDLKRDKNLELRPIIGYVSNFQEIEAPPSLVASKKAKKEILVTTFVKFIRPQFPQWSAEPSTKSRGYESFTYILELDKDNNIIGGSWISFNRPDFVVLNRLGKFQKNFKNLDSIYDKSIGVMDEKLKLKALAQKEFIMENISKKRSPEISSLMLEEYFDNYKKQLMQKKSEKKIARSKLSREITLTQKEILKKIKSIPINKLLKNLSLKFIELAEINPENKELYKIQSSFLVFVRNNYNKVDMINSGRVAYLQQKYIDDFLKDKKIDYSRIDFIQKSILMESELFSKKSILTSDRLFLSKMELFFQGINQEKEKLKSNPLGQLRIRKILPKSQLSTTSPIILAFIEDVKKDLNKVKLSNSTHWKRFLSEKKTTNWSKINIPNNLEEMKNYNISRDFNTYKKMYRLSFSIKRIQALKKVQTIPSYNNQKEKVEYYLSKFQKELAIFKFKEFFKPFSNLESIILYNNPPFKNPILQRESSSLLDLANKDVAQFTKDANNLFSAIKNNHPKILDDLLKNNLLLNFETENQLNPLLIAVSEVNKDAINKILHMDTNVSINYEDQMGKNALTMGIIKNLDYELLKLLVDKGIDFNARDNLGLYPRDYLKRTNNFDQYLESLGGRLSQKKPH